MASRSIEDRLANVFARTTTREMVKALQILEASPRGLDERWTRAAIIEELERRYPAASDAVGEAFDQATTDEPIDYAAVLIAAIPEEDRR